MTVFKLIEILQKYPMSMEVITTLHSGYEDIEENDISLVKAVRMPNYSLRFVNDYRHKIYKDVEEQYIEENTREYVHFEGN